MPYSYSYASTWRFPIHRILPLDEQDRMTKQYHDDLKLPPWYGLRTYGERPGHFVDRFGVSTADNLIDRPEGVRVLNLPSDGDHLVMASVECCFRHASDWSAAMTAWSLRGATVHFIRDGLVVPSGGRFAGDLRVYLDWRLQVWSFSRHFSDWRQELGLGPQVRPKETSVRQWRGQAFVPLTGGPPRIFPYIQSCSRADELGLAPFRDQEQLIRGYCEQIRLRNPKLEMRPLTYDNLLKTQGMLFRFRPESMAIWRAVRAGDHVVAFSVPAAFRSMDDLRDVADHLASRGAFLHLVEPNVGTDSADGRELFANLTKIFQADPAISTKAGGLTIADRQTAARRKTRPTTEA